MQSRVFKFFLLALISFAIDQPNSGFAQQIALNELTVGINVQTFGVPTCTLIGSGPECEPGIGHTGFYAPSLTFTHNLSPSLALEGTVLPASPFLDTNSLGSGRLTLALGGVRTGWRGRRWGIYGKIHAGVASYSCGTFDYNPTAYSDCARLTNFALEYGGVVEYRVRARWTMRVDAAHLLMPEFDQTLAQGPNFLAIRGADTLQHADLRVGIARSFGALHEAIPEQSPDRSSWDMGALFALQPRTWNNNQIMNPFPSWGLWTSWNFSRHISWDSAALHSGRNPGQFTFSDYQQGGRALETFTGLMVGIRRDHLGYFGKLRGGTITFGETEKGGQEFSGGIIQLYRGMFTNPVLDTGGVLEVYLSRHSILRFDAGSATIFFQPKNVTETVLGKSQTFAIPSQSQTTVLISFGAGFRF